MVQLLHSFCLSVGNNYGNVIGRHVHGEVDFNSLSDEIATLDILWYVILSVMNNYKMINVLWIDKKKGNSGVCEFVAQLNNCRPIQEPNKTY